MNQMLRHAQQTFLAMKDPFHSVERVYPLAIREVERNENTHYMGVKNVAQIPLELLNHLKNHGYEPHTVDRCSLNGRAVDVEMKNPLTGRVMTGSSSGTAVNVFLGINDLGIGTDGGGSVLAPAMSVQCFGFISPLIEQEHMRQYEKCSTDGLCFTPSLGFISRELELIREAAGICLDLKEAAMPVHVICPEELVKDIEGFKQLELSKQSEQCGQPEQSEVTETGINIQVEAKKFPVFSNKREPMINFLRQTLPGCDVLVHYERKIDVMGMGDSVFGHFDEDTQNMQLKSGKFLIRTANMAGATALCIPDTALASGYVLLCESKREKIEKLFGISKLFQKEKDELIERYFRTIDTYFKHGVLDHGLFDSRI